MNFYTWTVNDAAGPLGFIVDRTMFHATREEHVKGILDHGLLTGAPVDGLLRAAAGEDPNDQFYGTRPVYLLLEPAASSTYQWDRWDADEDEEPVLLEVDARGLTLLPDLATLEIPHYVWTRPEGIGWWTRKGGWPLSLDPARVPAVFAPFADASGVIPYPVLMTSAARTAVEFTKTAAVLEDIGPSRIRPYSGPLRRYEIDLEGA